jgi:hypothetical protein
MKKGKVLGKGQLAVGVMVVALVAAIWLNTKYMPTTTKYLGEASYVSNTSDNSVQTSATVEDSFTSAKKEREKALNTACERVEELLKSENLTEDDKKLLVLPRQALHSSELHFIHPHSGVTLFFQVKKSFAKKAM